MNNSSIQLQSSVNGQIMVGVDSLLNNLVLFEINTALKLQNLPEIENVTQLKKCKCYIRIPGGGDWSNTNLDLTNDPSSAITITFEI